LIRYDGVYRSAPIAWEESHGGGHWSGVSVYFWRFFPDGRWVSCSSEDHELGFYDIAAHNLDAPRGPAPRGHITGGSYEITGALLRVTEASLLFKAKIGPEWLVREWVISGDRLIPTEATTFRNFAIELFFDAHGHT
jgi:hypothetical protein